MNTICHAATTDVGRVRTANEDRWFADPAQGLYLVADGMGGSAAGGLASQIVAEVLPKLLARRLGGNATALDTQAAEQLSAVVAELSEQLREESRDAPGLRGMGSTVVLAMVRGTHAVISHLGDSRAYLLRAGKLRRLTKDHTIAQLLLDRGELTPEEAAGHPSQSRLTRFVGMGTDAASETETIELAPGDRLLLCTDGLTGMITDQQILAILTEHSDPEGACRRLVAAANEAGGKDNITVVVMQMG